MNAQTQTLLRNAEAAIKGNQLAVAVELYERAIRMEPDSVPLKRRRAALLLSLNKDEQAAHAFHDLHISHPDDSRFWEGAAVAYLKQGHFDMAIKFLMKLVAKDPKDYQSWTNLCLAAGSSGKHSDALFYAMQALQLQPLDSRAHNNLGSVLMMVNRYEDAIISFETALTLDPDNLDAFSNIATAYGFLGKAHKAIEMYEACFAKCKDKRDDFAVSLRYRMSFEYFRIGDLKKGWEAYEYGFDPMDVRTRNPKRKFSQPKWDGRPLQADTLLIWKEQGLGDELNFLSALPDAQKACEKIIVECDSRLVVPLSRSFPGVQFRPQAFHSSSMLPVHDDFNYQIPVGSMMAMYRQSLADFQRGGPYMKPHPERKKEFEQRLAKLGGKVKIGLSWRSGILNPERNLFYTALSDWEPILKLKDVTFVNVQYDDSSREISEVLSYLGVEVHQWDDLDLMNDLDGVFTLISCLDHVVTVDTSVSAMVKVVGTPCSILTPHFSHGLYGQGKYVTYPNVDTYINEGKQPLREVLPRIAADLAARYGLESRAD